MAVADWKACLLCKGQLGRTGGERDALSGVAVIVGGTCQHTRVGCAHMPRRMLQPRPADDDHPDAVRARITVGAGIKRLAMALQMPRSPY